MAGNKYKHPYDTAVPTFTNREGRPFHLNGVEREGADYYATLRMEDTGEFVRVKWERVKQYFETQEK